MQNLDCNQKDVYACLRLRTIKKVDDSFHLLFAFSKGFNFRQYKQDQKYAVKATEVPSLLGLDKMVNRAWFVQPSCAKERKGLDPGLNWLIQNTASKFYLRKKYICTSRIY